MCVNKWDAVEKDDRTMKEYTDKLKVDFSFMSYVPFLFISAKTGQRVDKMFPLINEVAANSKLRIPTGRLNDLLSYATARVQPPSDKGKRLKIYYMTQASTNPPTFVCFVNRADLFHFSYQRYLENQLRETFGLEGTPVRFIMRPPHLGQRPGISTTRGMVKLHSGKPGQAKNRPNRPDFTTRFRPQTGQISSETSSGTLI